MNQEIQEVKQEVVGAISSNIEGCSGVAADFLSAHKWKANRIKDDRFLDAYSQVIEDLQEAEFYLGKIKRVRSEESLFNWAEEYSAFFEAAERNLENMREKINA